MASIVAERIVERLEAANMRRLGPGAYRLDAPAALRSSGLGQSLGKLARGFNFSRSRRGLVGLVGAAHAARCRQRPWSSQLGARRVDGVAREGPESVPKLP
jgi:hypothetical protein